MTRKVPGKALLTLALWLAAIFALAAPGQAAHHSRRYHHGHRRHHHVGRPPGSRRRSRKSPGGPARVHYLPPELSVGPAGTIQGGKPSQPVQRGTQLTVYVGPFFPDGGPANRQDKITVKVSYLYRPRGDTRWTHGALRTVTLSASSRGAQKGGELTVGDWEELTIQTDSQETYAGETFPDKDVYYEAGQSVVLTGRIRLRKDGDDYLRRRHHRLGHRSHYTPPNSR